MLPGVLIAFRRTGRYAAVHSASTIGLAKWVGANHPKISVILASREARQTDAANELCDHIPFFRKPYDLTAIVAEIRATLDQAQSS